MSKTKKVRGLPISTAPMTAKTPGRGPKGGTRRFVPGPFILQRLGDAFAGAGHQAAPIHLRASGSLDYCARAEAIGRVYGDEKTAMHSACGKSGAEKHPIHVQVPLAIGTAMHAYLQDDVLGPSGIIYGRWRCKGCGAIWGRGRSKDWVQHPGYIERTTGTLPNWDHPPIDRRTGKRKITAACDTHRYEFWEPSGIDKKHRLGGHIDGGIMVGGVLVGFEIKTMSERQFMGLKQPLARHLAQANIYMHIFGLKAMVFCYISKGWHPGDPKPYVYGHGHSFGPIKEFLIQRDDSMLADLFSNLDSAQKAVEQAGAGSKDPDWPQMIRSCSRRSNNRCKACPVSDVCWDIRDGVTVTGI